MKKKGNRHKTQRAHRRALKRAAIITMAGAAVIIGAYSLVSKSIPAWTIATGRPAKVVKQIAERSV